ncbi:RidA family protein [Bradyrhizobium sp. USDA 336]|uniref:RidA family protein n=1 Tax=Bradyrhizobium sp. USDA 336 TaxID=3156311 RepID=UPI00383241C4
MSTANCSTILGRVKVAGQKTEQRMNELGVLLPSPSAPPAIYSPWCRVGDLVRISGQPPYWNGSIRYKGKVGKTLSLLEGRDSARISALNVLAHLRSVCGDLDRVVCAVHLMVFVNASADFSDVHRVADGASELLTSIFPHLPPPTRSSLGCSTLPMGIATEVEASFLIDAE